MTQYELLQNVFGNLRYFHELKVNGCVKYETIEYVLPQLQLMAYRVVNFCFTPLGCQLDISGVSRVNSKLANLLVAVIPVELEIMHICSTNLKASKSEEVGCFIKQLLDASPDILREYLIHLQQNMVNAITRSTSACSIHVMIELLLIILTDVPKDVIRHDKLFVLLARVGALIREVAILVCNLEENSMDEENMNEISCASRDLLENIELLKEDLKHVFLKAPANSSQLCFPMSDGLLFMTLLLRNLNDLLNSNAYSVALIKEEIGRVKEDLELIRSFFEKVEQELNRDLWARVLDVAYEAEHATNSILARDQGFEEETEWIIRKLTSRPAEIDVISIKIFNQVIGLKGSFNEDSIDNDVADKLRKYLFRKRCLIVLDDLWDTATWVELTRPLYTIPSEFQKGSRVILTKSWELLEKRVFGEERCPDELKDVGDKIAQKCGGLPLVLDLIGGVISRKEKKEALWLEVLNNLSSFIFKDEEEVMKVIQLSYDHLSDHLKPCFLYLASYPKDKDIEISSLKDLWSDEGLVEPTALKSVLEVYVDELISSSLVIVRGGRNPYVKHLLYLEIDCGYLAYNISCNFHLRHLRLLKRLEIQGMTLRETLLNEIGMLVHLRCLIIEMKAKALPPSVSNLCNLETLMVNNRALNMVLSPSIWSLAKLRRASVSLLCSVFDSDIDKTTMLENLTSLTFLKLSCSVESEDIFKRFPNLRTLEFCMECSALEQIYCPRLDGLNKLEKVCARFKCRGHTHVHQFDFHFPLSLKEVNFHGFDLSSDELSIIGRSLPNLQKLELGRASIEGGKEWEHGTSHLSESQIPRTI
ncbi:hypothetical protein P3S68_024605 [Capsicum galapagoense]